MYIHKNECETIHGDYTGGFGIPVIYGHQHFVEMGHIALNQDVDSKKIVARPVTIVYSERELPKIHTPSPKKAVVVWYINGDVVAQKFRNNKSFCNILL